MLKRIRNGLHPDRRRGGIVASPVPFGRSWHSSRKWVASGTPCGGRVPCGLSAAAGLGGQGPCDPDVPFGHEWIDNELSFDDLVGFFGPDALAD